MSLRPYLRKAYRECESLQDKALATIKRASPRDRDDPTDWSYYAAVDEIFHSRWAATHLARFEVVRRAVKHFWPDGYPVKLIQVAGTSGKGSTCQFIQAGLSRYGKAGCYVKPHVFDYAERFIVGNSPATHAEIYRAWERKVKPFCIDSAARGDLWTLEHREASLLIALHIFDAHRLQWAAVETGMGGRFDPVTALDVVATALTNVGKDHEDVLGSEPWQRALEKAGVCRPGVPLFTTAKGPEVLEVLRAVSSDVGSPLVEVSRRDVDVLRRASEREGAEPTSLMSSEHQLWNAALAASVTSHLVNRATVPELVKAFAGARFVGRFWPIEEGVYADVAHNPSKTEALAEQIRQRFPQAKAVFVMGITGRRDPVAVAAPLLPQAKALVVTSAGYKGQDPVLVCRKLRSAFPSADIRTEPEPRDTLSLAKSLRSGSDLIIFTGSTYMIDQALNTDARLRHLNGTYGWREALPH